MWLILALIAAVAATACAEDLPDAPSATQRGLPDYHSVAMFLRPVQPARKQQTTFHWKAAVAQTFTLLAMEQSFRMVQTKTRDHLGGPFFADWFSCVGNLHGWNDGDSFLTNYIGHPIHSSWAGYIEIQNDPLGRDLQFENSERYWMSRFRALGWAELYEIQWHLGPISEASIGHVGRRPTHTLGYVNIVSSAPGGFGLIVLQDWLDKHVVAPREAHTSSLNKRRFYRMLFNPSRALTNLFRGKKPWYRDYRPIDWTPGNELALRPSPTPSAKQP